MNAPPVDVAVLFFMVVRLVEELISPVPPPPPPPHAVKKTKQTSFMNLVFISHQLTNCVVSRGCGWRTHKQESVS